MRFTFPHSHLSRAVQTVARAVAARSPHPAATAIRLSVSDNSLLLDATDGEMHISVALPGEVEVSGTRELLLPGKYFAEVISRLGDGDVEIEIAEDHPTATVRWHTTEFVINGWEQDSLPPPSTVAPHQQLSVSPSAFRTAASRVLPATSSDDTRPVLTGVFMHISGGEARLVATDGFRLAYQLISVPVGLPEEVQMVIPSRSISLLNHLLSGVDDDALLGISERSLTVDLGTTNFVTSLIAGQFPNYQQVIPKEFAATFTCDRNSLIEACERASIAASEDNRAVNLSFSPGSLDVSTGNTDRGRMNERISCEGVDRQFQITFNARFLIDGLRTTSTDNIRIDIINESQLIRLRNEENDDFCYIVLPLRRVT